MLDQMPLPDCPMLFHATCVQLRAQNCPNYHGNSQSNLQIQVIRRWSLCHDSIEQLRYETPMQQFAIKSADTSDTQMKFVSWFYRTIALWNTNAATEKHRSWKSDTPCSARNSRLAESARFSDVFHDLAAKANLEAWQNHGVPRRIVVGDGGAELCWLQWDYWPYTNH